MGNQPMWQQGQAGSSTWQGSGGWSGGPAQSGQAPMGQGGRGPAPFGPPVPGTVIGVSALSTCVGVMFFLVAGMMFAALTQASRSGYGEIDDGGALGIVWVAVICQLLGSPALIAGAFQTLAGRGRSVIIVGAMLTIAAVLAPVFWMLGQHVPGSVLTVMMLVAIVLIAFPVTVIIVALNGRVTQWIRMNRGM